MHWYLGITAVQVRVRTKKKYLSQGAAGAAGDLCALIVRLNDDDVNNNENAEDHL